MSTLLSKKILQQKLYHTSQKPYAKPLWGSLGLKVSILKLGPFEVKLNIEKKELP